MRRYQKVNNINELKMLLLSMMLGVFSFIVMQISIPIIPGASFLKLDCSDIIIMVSFFVFNPIVGSTVAIVRGILCLIIGGFNLIALLGQIAALVASLCYIFPIYFWSKNKMYMLKYKIIGILLGTCGLTISMSIINYYVLLPLYMQLVNFKINDLMAYILFLIAPFNLIKGIINGILFLILSNKIIPTLQKFIEKNC